MMRFIFACMAVVAVSAAFMMSQGITAGIDNARDEVLARNAPATIEPAAAPADEGVSFEEIYAGGKAPQNAGDAFFSPEELNNIDTAAGEDFKGGFTDEAPKALKEQTPQPETLEATEPSAQ